MHTPPSQVENLLEKLTLVNDLTTAGTIEVIIEAASENKNIKKAIFQTIDALPGMAEAHIFTNTSSLSITDMAQLLKRPAHFLGLHFMNPVPVMPLVEVIPHTGTGAATTEMAQKLCDILGKKAVYAKDQPGFIVNRLLIPYINQAIIALDEDLATAHDIDIAMTDGANMPMGPLTLADFIGLDTCLAIMQTLYEDFKHNPCYSPAPLLKKMVNDGKLGKKSGQGFFCY